jgi:hypothetical protein
MSRYLIILLVFTSAPSFGQFDSVADFHRKIMEIGPFDEFILKHAVPMKDYRTRHDTTRIDTTYILHFDKHPNLDKSSGGGRLEMFNSIFADSTSVYQVSQRLYLSFKKISEGRIFMNRLRYQLRKVSWKEVKKKSDVYDEYIIYSHELLDSTGKIKSFIFTENAIRIVFRLIPNRTTNECDLYIGF